MNRGKKIEGNLSSLVELKAELFRKQEEARRSLINRNATTQPLKLTGKVKAELDAHDRRHKGLSIRGSKSNRPPPEEDNEEVNKALEVSRKKLEEKAKLYEKLTSCSQENDDDELYMVDFNRKVANKAATAAPVQNPTHSMPDNIEVDEEAYKANDEHNEWVEYVDSLGRSRKCLKKDLPEMKAMDYELQRKNAIPPPISLLEDEILDELQTPEIPNSKQKGPLHYQNVQHNEIRNHGVGYFEFSVEEETRAKQLEQLTSLRNQTKDQRLRREKLKEKRQNALKERLKKVKQRKLMKTGEKLPESDTSDEDEFISETIDEKPNSQIKEISEQVDRPPTVRPWDRGKMGTRINQPFTPAQPSWVDQRRSDRETDFAPPQFYSQRERLQNERKTEFAPPPNYNKEDKRVESMYQFFQQTQKEYGESNPENIPLPDEVLIIQKTNLN